MGNVGAGDATVWSVQRKPIIISGFHRWLQLSYRLWLERSLRSLPSSTSIQGCFKDRCCVVVTFRCIASWCFTLCHETIRTFCSNLCNRTCLHIRVINYVRSLSFPQASIRV